MLCIHIFLLSALIPEFYAVKINYGSDTNQVENPLIITRTASESCDGDESITLEMFNLTKIPNTAIKSKTIRQLNLHRNLLTDVPVEIFDNIPSLECLNIARNQIPYMNIFDFQHPTLKTLIVDHQNNEEDNSIPCFTCNYPKAYLPELEMLHANGLGSYVIDKVPVHLFPKLHTLYLTDNDFTEIDVNFLYSLPIPLKHLHLERNRISYFEGNHIRNLVSLYLDENPLKNIDFSSNVTNNLNILSLRKCTLDSEIFRGFNTLYSLNILDLSENRFEYVPESLFSYARNLKKLFLNNNFIKNLPDINNFWQISHLSLSYNNIENVNNLKSYSLTILSLDNNKISEITDFSFKMIPALKALDLSHNRLKYLSPGWANNLGQLEEVHLEFNMFQDIRDMSLSSTNMNLRNLYITGNKFHEIEHENIQFLSKNCTIYVA